MKPATCHPDRPHYAVGHCKSCYNMANRKKPVHPPTIPAPPPEPTLDDAVTAAVEKRSESLAKRQLKDAIKRITDQRAIIDLTDGLSRVYKSQRLAVRLARQLGLVLFDNSPAVKRVLARYASGLGGVVPDLVCGIPFAQIDF